jgi:hypothetical protein
MGELKLYEYAVILQPKLDKDGEIVEDGAIVVNLTTVLAEDQAKATLLAGRAIPEKEIAKLDRITVAVRPF